MNLEAKAPGKLILLGEYSVLEGSPALVTSVDRCAEVQIQKQISHQSSFDSASLNVRNLNFQFDIRGNIVFAKNMPANSAEKLKFFKSTLEYLQKNKKIDLEKNFIRIYTDTASFYQSSDFGKYGLGSSAAITVALTGGLLSFFSEKHISPELNELFQTAMQVHHLAQGKSGSGVDIAASTFGGLVEYQRNPEENSYSVRQREMPKDLFILPIWSGKPASTPELVAKVRDFKSNDPIKYHNLMDKFDALCHAGCQFIQENKTSEFLAVCQHYLELLSELGKKSGADIISAEHRKLAKLAAKSGGVYKPSGAGGGDLGLALTDSKTVYENTKQELLHSEFCLINFGLGKKGFSINQVKNNQE